MNFANPNHLLKYILLFRPHMKLVLITVAFLVALLGMAAPILQKIFVDHLTESYVSDPSIPIWVWLVLSGVALLLSLVCYQILTFLSTQEAVKTQHAIAQHLYKKLLSLRPLDYQRKTTGEFISVYATDIPSSTILVEQSLPQGLNIIFPLILAPAVLIGYFNVPAIMLLPLLFAFVLLNLGLAYRQSLFFYKFKDLAAKRIGIVNEWIQNIRALRILNWIPAFERKIHHAREIETHNRIRMLNNGQTMNAISSSMTFVLTACILWIITQKSQIKESPGNVLTIFWIVTVFLTRTFRQLPWFFTFLFDAWTSIKRVAEAFSLGSIEETQYSAKELNKFELKPDSFLNMNLKVTGLNLSVNNQKLLHNISFEIRPHEFVALVGSVGSGKTMLLLSLMGETDATFESYSFGPIDLLKIPRSEWKQFFSYVPQDGFLMSASLRDNLHFEYLASRDQDGQLLECLPKVQFDILAEGLTEHLDTEVGERGVNLSGGQKQRLSLARTLLKSAPIQLFDDCLSAVDVNTAQMLIDEIFKKDFARRIRILATARFQVLKNADRVLFLDQGQLIAFGNYEDLKLTSDSFYKFIHLAQENRKFTKELE